MSKKSANQTKQMIAASKKSANRTKQLIAAFKASDGVERARIEKQLKVRLKQLARKRKSVSDVPRQPGVIKAVSRKLAGGTTTVHRTHEKRFKGQK